MKRTPKKRNIEQYEHIDKDRPNNPEAGLVSGATDQEAGKKQYAHDPHLDPQLQWASKTERTSFDVPTVSLHVHERVDPKRIIEEVKKEDTSPRQQSLFDFDKKPLREAVEFYKHRWGWKNRMVVGDSLLVMNSLLEKEGMAGKVQMVYFDPPYGIKYGRSYAVA
jgi:adenine-specific DNA-methyltransferase